MINKPFLALRISLIEVISNPINFFLYSLLRTLMLLCNLSKRNPQKDNFHNLICEVYTPER